MASRGIAGLFIIAAFTGVISAQAPTPPYTNLIFTARGASADQALLFSVDTRSGKVQTLLNQTLGTLTDVTMDRDNAGFAVVYQGSKGTGIHFLARAGGAVTIHEACTLRSPSPNLCSLELSVEDLWLAGTSISTGVGRIGLFETAPPTLTETQNFPGQEVSEILIDRNQANVILALNGQAGGIVYSYDPAGASYSSTLARSAGFISDLAQDPCSGGLLASTNDPSAPFLFIDTSSTPPQVTSFRFPVAAFPSGVIVDAIAIDVRTTPAGIHPLWAMSGNRLFVLGWDSHKRTLIFPKPLLHYVLPFQNATAMIFEGDRDFLMTGTVASSKNVLISAMLRMRLGPAHAGQPYVIAASLANQPPVSLPGNRWINLRSDPLFFMSVGGHLPQVFEEFSGTTTLDGEVTGKVTPRREWSSALKGVTLYFAGVVLDANAPGHIRTVTNSVGLTLF